tara:strand:- start:192 stop:461 length:270 start_codon:yes stop_codon:yes gene_type:complete
MLTEFIEGFKPREVAVKTMGKAINKFRIKYCERHLNMINNMRRSDPLMTKEFETFTQYRMNKSGCSVCQYTRGISRKIDMGGIPIVETR